MNFERYERYELSATDYKTKVFFLLNYYKREFPAHAFLKKVKTQKY